MKKITLFITLLALMAQAMAQDTVRKRVEINRAIVKRTVVDTMAAQVHNDLAALDLRGNVQSVTTRTYDYLNNTVVEETRQLDEQGFCVASTRRIGHLKAGYASMRGDALPQGSVVYTNVVSMTNSYKNGKISRIEVQDMERGDYEVVYRYNLVGDVIGHDTLYNGERHSDYTARFDSYHNLTSLKEADGDHYTFTYVYDSTQHGKKLSMNTERYNPLTRTSASAVTRYHYDENNRMVRETTTGDENESQTDYTYDQNDLVIRKDTKSKGKQFEEITERDSYGSCVLRQTVHEGKIILQIFNDITYSQGNHVLS